MDALFIAYGGLVMIPVFFELARHPGPACAGLRHCLRRSRAEWGLFAVPATLKLVQMDIVNAGLNASIWTISPSFGGWAPLFVGVAILHLTPILLGIGLLWKGGIPRWSAGLLIVGAILLAVGVGGGADIAPWQTGVAAPLSTLAFLVALAPIGLRYLGGAGQVNALEPAAA